jgi:gliding motility-associated-like protein
MTLYIPNVFSPNADGINDTFFAIGEYIKEFQMRIFDRWGNMIFFSDDIDHHWDGKVKSNGEIAQQDVYVYDVRAKDINNKTRKYIGTVTLIK